MDQLNARQQAFAEAYVRLRVGKRAAIEAGYSQKTADSMASQLLSKLKVRDEINRLTDLATKQAIFGTADVMRSLTDRVIADHNEMSSVRVGCCRFCYGTDHIYQETPAERRARKQAHDQLLATTPQKEWLRIPPFDELGGVGYDPRKPPVEECPECFGEGVERVVFGDTRKLSRAGRAVYAGVKRTKDGMEIKTNSPDKALEMLAKITGLLRDETMPDDEPVGQLTFGGVYAKPRDG